MLKINRDAFNRSIESETGLKSHTILLVDDEPANLSCLSQILQEDYKVLEAPDGQAALDMVQQMENPEQIHLILSDQRMPRLTGIEFLSKTIPLMPKTIRMLLTGFTDLDSVVDSINKGRIYSFLTKPIEPVNLKLAVDQAIETYCLEQGILEKTARLLDVEKRLEREVSEAFISSLSPAELSWFLDAVKGMVLCDKGINGNEMDYLRTILSFVSNKKEAKRLVQMIKSRNSQSDLTEILDLDEKKSFEIATVLAKFASVDGKISNAEADFFRFACQKMGYNIQFATKMLSWAKNRIQVDLEHDRIRTISEGFRTPKSMNGLMFN